MTGVLRVVSVRVGSVRAPCWMLRAVLAGSVFRVGRAVLAVLAVFRVGRVGQSSRSVSWSKCCFRVSSVLAVRVGGLRRVVLAVSCWPCLRVVSC